MKKHNLALAILFALGLTACGSSGGSSSHTEMKTVTEVPSTINGQPIDSANTTSQNTQAELNPVEQPTVETPKAETPAEQPTIENPPQEKAWLPSVEANYISTRLEVQDKTVSLIRKAQTVEEKPNQIYVEKQLFELSPSVNINANNMIRTVSTANYTAHGILRDPSLEKAYLFANGVQPTKDISGLTGEVVYLGRGYHAFTSGADVLVDNSNVKLDVNFNDKTVKGVISSPKNSFQNVALDAQIEQNGFAGTTAEGIKTEGRFFGPNAEEVIGNYSDNKTLQGVFNATKQ